MKKFTRRIFLYLSTVAVLSALIKIITPRFLTKRISNSPNLKLNNKLNLGVDNNGFSRVYLARNATPEENMAKVLEMSGGIEKIIQKNDIVILKPNAQWWAQGMTNTNVMKEFIQQVMAIPGFEGEVIIAENHHFPEDNSRGWTTKERNGEFNYNELINYFQNIGFKNVTKYHWHDGGSSYPKMHGGAENGGIVTVPEDGDGYVWCENLIYEQPNGRKTMMSYPIFTSEYSGYTIDFKNGIWRNGKYIKNKKFKLVNFAVLNYHDLVGVTSSIKNYLGIIDLTCGFRGKKPEGFDNFHYVGTSNLPWRIKKILKRIGYKEGYEYIAGAIAYFMKHVYFADLNIVTAEYVGYGSRIDPNFAAHSRAILAGKDPVALDYIGAKRILLRDAKVNKISSEIQRMIDPDDSTQVFRKFLNVAHSGGIGNLSSEKIKVIEN
jgi:uncharacterized protein (DUF362 family)